MVWPSKSLLLCKAHWEDLTIVSYMACLEDQTPYIKISFSVSSPVRWVISPILSLYDPRGGSNGRLNKKDIPFLIREGASFMGGKRLSLPQALTLPLSPSLDTFR
eukprot:Gb_16404 [translate_table: standard]